MPMRSDMVVPATRVRFELSKILPKIKGNRFYTLTYKGYPKVALVDLQYLEELERWYKFERAFQAGTEAFTKYLKKVGKNINTITEKEADAIIGKFAGLS